LRKVTVQLVVILCNSRLAISPLKLVPKEFHHDDPEGGSLTPILDWSVDQLGAGPALVHRARYGCAARSPMATRADTYCEPIATKHYRFLGGVKELSPAELKRLCDVDGRHSMAFVATVQGIACYRFYIDNSALFARPV
jgi:hypothetical protein